MPRSEAKGRPSPSAMAFRGRHVLVVDDEAPVRSSLTRILRTEGAEVSTAASLIEAIEAASNGTSFDAAVVDYWLLGERGPELISWLRSLAQPCCALLITGTRNPEIGREAIASGAEDFLLKPFSVQDFLDGVQRTIERTEAWRDRINTSAPLLARPRGRRAVANGVARQTSRARRKKLPVRLMSREDLSSFVETMASALTLSHKQLKVLHRLMAGDAVELIARDLGVTTRTVKYHACGIYKKVGVHSRVELQSVLFDRFGA